MVYTCNVKGQEEVDKLRRNEHSLHRSPRSSGISKILEDDTSKFKAT